MGTQDAANPAKPYALTSFNAARLLTKAAGQMIAVDAIETDLAAGAPANADGAHRDSDRVRAAVALISHALRGLRRCRIVARPEGSQ